MLDRIRLTAGVAEMHSAKIPMIHGLASRLEKHYLLVNATVEDQQRGQPRPSFPFGRHVEVEFVVARFDFAMEFGFRIKTRCNNRRFLYYFR